MPAKRSLSEMERTEAQQFVRQGKANARTLTRAWTLLKLADGWDEARIAETFAISPATVKNVTHRFVEGGLGLVLHDRIQQRRRQALTGKPPAHLIAMSCSVAPDGHDRLPRTVVSQQSGRTGFCEEHFAEHDPPTTQ